MKTSSSSTSAITYRQRDGFRMKLSNLRRFLSGSYLAARQGKLF